MVSTESCSKDITSKVNIANWIGEEVDGDTMAHYYKRINSGLAELIETYGGTTSVDPESVCLPCGVEVRLPGTLMYCAHSSYMITIFSFFAHLFRTKLGLWQMTM